MSDHISFLRAICADPENDTVRLAFADWLEEQESVPVACVRCRGSGELLIHRGRISVSNHDTTECPDCLGSGSIFDNYNQNYANYIRSSIRLVDNQSNPTAWKDMILQDPSATNFDGYREMFHWFTSGMADEELRRLIGGDCRGIDGEYAWCRQSLQENDSIVVVWQRGFICKLSTSMKLWSKYHPQLLRYQPVREVRITTWMDYLSEETETLPSKQRQKMILNDFAEQWPGVTFQISA